MKTWNKYYQDQTFRPTNIVLHWQYLLKILTKRPHKTLEIGCGLADHSIFLKKIKPNLQIYLMDLDREILEKTSQKYSKQISKVYFGSILDSKK